MPAGVTLAGYGWNTAVRGQRLLDVGLWTSDLGSLKGAGRMALAPVELRGKKVIALGERDGVPAPAIAACAQSAGAEVVLEETYCFV
jgi:glycine reductase